jgi:hypothetical protein
MFSFKSDKVGIFNEEWELLTEPALETALPNLALSGVCVAEDELVGKREKFWRDFEQQCDILANVSDDGLEEFASLSRTPKKLKKSIRDPEVFAHLFEESNRDHVVYYTKPVMDGFLDLLDSLDHYFSRFKGQALLPTFEWSTKVAELEQIIKQIDNPYTR